MVMVVMVMVVVLSLCVCLMNELTYLTAAVGGFINAAPT